MTNQTEHAMAPPSAELVNRAMRELEWAERFELHKMNPGAGNERIEVYNFPNLVNVMFGTRWDRVVALNNHASIVWVNLDGLVSWLRGVLGDEEFAEAVAVAAATSEAYKEQLDVVATVFRERILQYRAVLDEAEAQDEDE